MARDRNRLCIEDPFEISYNVARTVTKDGLYTVRKTARRNLALADTPSFVASLCAQRG
jgi:terminal uridylyltransferase